jgi:hypothetical protein
VVQAEAVLAVISALVHLTEQLELQILAAAVEVGVLAAQVLLVVQEFS